MIAEHAISTVPSVCHKDILLYPAPVVEQVASTRGHYVEHPRSFPRPTAIAEGLVNLLLDNLNPAQPRLSKPGMELTRRKLLVHLRPITKVPTVGPSVTDLTPCKGISG